MPGLASILCSFCCMSTQPCCLPYLEECVLSRRYIQLLLQGLQLLSLVGSLCRAHVCNLFQRAHQAALHNHEHAWT